jgi:hypothetical protein
MYYNRILGVWVIDVLDYFLISTIIGSLVASHLKNYLSEKAAMERLKRSIINKSKLASNTNTPILNSKEAKKRKIYKFALDRRGGQFLPPPDHEFSNEVFTLAQKIKGIVERLAAFLKQKELKGIAKIFFKNGRLILDLLLYKCNITITYSVLSEGLSTQVIVLTATVGGAAGFTLSWFSVGASLVAPPLLISALFLRSVTQQFLNQREYSNFKRMVNEMLNDDKLKETIQAFFMEGEGLTPSSGGLEMKPVDFNEISALKYDFNLKSDDNLEEFIKARMQEELGLIENPTERQLEEIIHRKVKRKPKGKTVFFGDFIDKMPYEGADLSDSDIIDTEILEEPIRIKLDDEF